MCGAPSPIDEKQLREANIRLAPSAPKTEPPPTGPITDRK
jgi:hypothetical protein